MTRPSHDSIAVAAGWCYRPAHTARSSSTTSLRHGSRACRLSSSHARSPGGRTPSCVSSPRPAGRGIGRRRRPAWAGTWRGSRRRQGPGRAAAPGAWHRRLVGTVPATADRRLLGSAPLPRRRARSPLSARRAIRSPAPGAGAACRGRRRRSGQGAGHRLVRGAVGDGADPLQAVVLLLAQVEAECGEIAVELHCGARADHGNQRRRAVGRPAAQPGHGHLGGARVTPVGDLEDGVQDGRGVRGLWARDASAVSVTLPVLAREQTAGQRRVEGGVVERLRPVTAGWSTAGKGRPPAMV